MNTRKTSAPSLFLLLPAFFLLSPWLPAQAPNHLLFKSLSREYYRPARNWILTGFPETDVLLLDADGDGDLDILREGIQLYWNLGKSVFSQGQTLKPTSLPVGFPHLCTAAGDLDRDGDTDLLIPCKDKVIHLLLNNGKGLFTDLTKAMFPNKAYDPTSLSLFDADGDGDLDLLVTVGYPTGLRKSVRFFLNDGKGRFSEPSPAPLPPPGPSAASAFPADLDGDGDVDLLVSTSTGPKLWLNDGKGRFTDGTSGRIPPSPNSSYTIAFQVGDIDGDLDLDIFEVHAMEQGRILINDGKGKFKDETAGRLPTFKSYTRVARLVDLDLDGDLDLLLGRYRQYDLGPIKLLLNDGKGRFKDATPYLFTHLTRNVTDMELGDLDGDGDLDLVLPGRIYPLFFNDGKGHFLPSEPARVFLEGPKPWYASIEAGDFNGDGLQDIFSFEASPHIPSRARIYLGDGFGHFLRSRKAVLPTFSEPVSYFPLLSLDADGDGDLDLLLEDSIKGRTILWRNQGNLAFKEYSKSMPPSDGVPQRVAVAGDLDGDGDLDLVLGAGTADYIQRIPEVLLINDGKGNFTDATAGRLPQTGSHAVSMVLGDIDRDGDLDLVLGLDLYASKKTGGRLYLNNGKGKFTDATNARLPGAAGKPGWDLLSLGDVDGDGDLDLFAMSWNLSYSSLYLNNGNGFFKDLGTSRFPANIKGYCAKFMDVDHDGDLDLVGSIVLLNNGKGFFTHFAGAVDGALSGRYTPMYGNFPRFLDLDGDGDEEILFHSIGFGYPWVFFNLERQIHAPYLPALGRVYQVRVFGNPGDGVLPLLSKGKAHLPLGNMGTLFLSTQGMAALPLQWLNPSGTASFYLHIPRIPVLLGAGFYTQALLVKPGPNPKVHLTNALSETILGI